MIHLLRHRSFLFSICLLAFLATACLQDPERPQNVPKAPTVSIDQAFLTRTSMTLTGSFDAGATLFGWGFEMTEGSFTNGVITKIENPRRLESGTFEYVVPVKQGTHYSVRSYISNGRQNLYSEEVSVITPNSSVPTLSDVVLNGRTVSARILDDGGRKINEAGFYWGETPQDVRKNKAVVPVIDSTISYSIDPTELENKSYYFQGYAENSDGEGEMYGFSHNLLEVRINEESPVGIRDEEFNRYLLNLYDKDGNEILTFRELGAVTRIELNTDNIHSLKEIRFMPMLETLICMGSDVQSGGLVELDVSKNGRLTTLKCDNNKIESLDLSNNTQLAFLSCSGNMLSRLDVSTCPELKELLSTDCPTLKEICIFPGQDVSGFLLDHTVVFSMPNTISIPISDINFKQYLLSQFDADQDGALSGIEASRIEQIQVNTDHIKSIEEIRFFPNLKSLSCTGSWDSSRNTAIGQLESLDVSKNTSLTRLYCNNNLLTSLDVSENTMLRELDCSGNLIKFVIVWDDFNRQIMAFYSIGNAITYVKNNDITEIQIADNEFKKYLIDSFDGNGDGKISQTEATFIERIQVNTDNIKSMEEIQYFPNLKSLSCVGSSKWDGSHNIAMGQLKILDVSNNSSLTYLHCGSNQLQALDVSNNAMLIYLNCTSNQLTSLDVSKNTSLTALHCSGNQLMSLDVSENTLLRELSCSCDSIKFVIVWEDFDPQIMKSYYIGDAIFYVKNNDNTEIRIKDNEFKRYLIDVFDGNGDGKLSQTEALFIERIQVNTDNIKSMEEIQYFPNLKSLSCVGSSEWDGSHNIAMGQLKSLDVSKNPKLTNLACHSNQLTSLDLSGNTMLTTLFCSNNQLTRLVISKSPMLTELLCSDNQLMSLDVSKNTALSFLDCCDNQLTSLDVSENTLLEYLYCSNNRLTDLDVSGNPTLCLLKCNDNPFLAGIWLKSGQKIASFYYDTDIVTIRYKD